MRVLVPLWEFNQPRDRLNRGFAIQPFPAGEAHSSGSDIANGPPHLDFRVPSPTFAGIRWSGFGTKIIELCREVPVSRDQIFISYSYKDKKWREELETHLKQYLRNGSITS